MESDEKIQAHILSVWREGKEFVGGRSLEGMLFLTNRHLMFIRKTESKMMTGGSMMGNTTAIKLDMIEYKKLSLSVGDKVFLELSKAESSGV